MNIYSKTRLTRLENKNINLLWSAGHNSALTLTLLQKDGYKVNSLISIISKASNEIPNHGTPDVLIKNQAKALSIPSLRVFTETDSMDNLDNLNQINELYTKKNLNNYALSNCDTALAKLFEKKLKNIICPLTNNNSAQNLKLFLELGHKAIITSIDEEFVPLKFLGKDLSFDILDELNTFPKNSFHTYTTYSPQFRTRMTYSKSITVKRDKYTIIRLREV